MHKQYASGRVYYGAYTFHHEYNYRRYYDNMGYEIRYVWVWEVQDYNPGLRDYATVGWAHKLCGAEWVQTNFGNVG
ncbi:hypothetical protein AB0H49_26980 [Nocardia sp. NPDC050713]|uniref:hypothetical protein n=1 Tax=Nocardia sp. NPDC050713 TaxID=3154511 RepID=UPI00340F2AAB